MTQGTQTDQNTVGLVAGRTAVLRAYARTTGSAATANVSLAIVASRDGVLLSGSPLVVGPRAVSPAPTRGTFDSSFNVTLPAAWLSGRVSLTATIDSAGAVTELNETNNVANATVTFVTVPPLDVMIVPIRYTHAPNGQVYPAPAVDTISGIIAKLYPVSSVNVAWHAPVAFSGDLGQSSAWSTLLNQVTSLRQSEVGSNSPRFYYALVPIQNSTGAWFNSGVAGIGWISGNRASVGLDLGGTSAGFIAAHEMGHNLGRYHAPCGGPSGVDANYPYANASIGQFGLDVATSRVWSPGAPDNAKDVMGYCNPKWISDYTYAALLTALRSTVQLMGASTPANGLLVRADFPENGSPTLQPMYALPTAPIDAQVASDYTLELLDASGAVLLSWPTALLQASAHDTVNDGWRDVHPHRLAEQDTPAPAVRSIQAVLPQPAQPVARVRLSQSGSVIAEKVLTALTPGQSNVITGLQPDSSGVLRWGVTDRAALVQMTIDDGMSWITLAVDVIGGELQIDLASLPVGPSGSRRFQVILSDAVP